MQFFLREFYRLRHLVPVNEKQYFKFYEMSITESGYKFPL